MLTRLDAQGQPVISPSSDLKDVRLILDDFYFPGTFDKNSLSLVTNDCTGEMFINNEVPTVPIIVPWTGFRNGSNVEETFPLVNPADKSLALLLKGEFDAIWTHAEIPSLVAEVCVNPASVPDNDVNCDIWSRFGNEFAFIHTGIPSSVGGGSALSMQKIGSNLAEILDPCIEEYLKTEDYLDICKDF